MKLDHYFAAFDLGTSKIVGVIGQRNSDNTITIQAIEKEDSLSSIKRGCIQNLDDVATKIKRIIRKLNNQVQPEIERVYVSIGGQSVRSIDCTSTLFFGAENVINEATLEQLVTNSRNQQPESIEVLDIVENYFLVDDQKTRNPLGKLASEVVANHKVIISRPAIYKNLLKCFEDKVDIEIADTIPSALAASASILSDEEISRGCALVDFGAGTTTVTVFKDGVLAHTAVIPFGGQHITMDITSLGLTEIDAEKLKLSQGSARFDDTADNKILRQQVATANDGTKIELQKLHHVIEARIEEILLNIGAQIDESGYERHQLEAGIIIIGGASQLKNLPAFITEKLGMDVKKGILPKTISVANAEVGALSGLNIVAGLLMLAEVNCSAYVAPPVVEQPAPKTIEPEFFAPVAETEVEKEEPKITHQPIEEPRVASPRQEPKNRDDDDNSKPKKKQKSSFLDGIGRLFSVDD